MVPAWVCMHHASSCILIIWYSWVAHGCAMMLQYVAQWCGTTLHGTWKTITATHCNVGFEYSIFLHQCFSFKIEHICTSRLTNVDKLKWKQQRRPQSWLEHSHVFCNDSHIVTLCHIQSVRCTLIDPERYRNFQGLQSEILKNIKHWEIIVFFHLHPDNCRNASLAEKIGSLSQCLEYYKMHLHLCPFAGLVYENIWI